MAKAYNKHHLHHQQSFFNKTTFFPLICRTSVKEVKLRESKDESSSPSADPSSPKISCIGQIIRTQKFSPTPPQNPMTSAVVSTKTRDGQVRYTALKRWFSGRKTAGTCIGGGCCRSGGEMMVMMSSTRNGSRRCSKINNFDDGNFVQNIEKLDPPLPVIKNLIPAAAVEVNLWNRRCGGVALTSLQIENHIQLAKKNYQIA